MELLLQRQLNGDASKWRTIGRFNLEDIDEVMSLSSKLAIRLEQLTMRLVKNEPSQAVAYWTTVEGWKLLDA